MNILAAVLLPQLISDNKDDAQPTNLGYGWIPLILYLLVVLILFINSLKNK